MICTCVLNTWVFGEKVPIHHPCINCAIKTRILTPLHHYPQMGHPKININKQQQSNYKMSHPPVYMIPLNISITHYNQSRKTYSTRDIYSESRIATVVYRVGRVGQYTVFPTQKLAPPLSFLFLSVCFFFISKMF